MAPHSKSGRFLSGERIVVISDGLWKRRFASDPSIIGKKITINRTEWEVVGVMPAGFTVPSKETDLWLPWDIARTYNAQRFPKGPPRDWRFLNPWDELNRALPLKKHKIDCRCSSEDWRNDFPKQIAAGPQPLFRFTKKW